MTKGFASIITELEQRRMAIDKALSALREIDEGTAPAQVTAASSATVETAARKGRKLSAAVRKRMQEAQRLRWAKIKGESERSSPVAKEAPKAKRKISPEGMKRIIAATKKRWALKRAAAKAA